jgi:hypothetical protein
MACSIMQAQTIYVEVNGDRVNFLDASPMMMNDRVLVPLRGVFEKMGATVDWNSSTRTVTAIRGGRTINLRIGDSYADVDGTRVPIDAPAIIRGGSTMVPLRFISESMGANVHWASSIRTVHISTLNSEDFRDRRGEPVVTARLPAGTVIEAILDSKLSSLTSVAGDRFTAHLADAYMGLPAGTVVEGRVDMVRKRDGNVPGVIGLDYLALRLPDGSRFPIDASLIGLDEKSVEHRSDGTIVARANAKTDDLKWVGIGAGAGALIAILTKGNVLTDAVIGAAVGYLYNLSQRNATSRDVVLDAGTRIGVKMNSALVVR